MLPADLVMAHVAMSACEHETYKESANMCADIGLGSFIWLPSKPKMVKPLLVLLIYKQVHKQRVELQQLLWPVRCTPSQQYVSTGCLCQ